MDDYPELNGENYKPDIVMMLLDKPFEMSKSVTPACLPNKPINLESICYVSGKVVDTKHAVPECIYKLRQWGAGNVYLFVLSSWKVNIAKNTIVVMGL